MIWFGVLVGFILWLIIKERSQRKTGAVAPGFQSDITFAHTSEWTLYHNDFSLCSKKIRVCLAELGVAYDSHHIDLIETGAYQNISREFLKVNPASTVPVLLHHGHPIYESHEQIRYAASQSGDTNPLIPEDATERQVMDIWVERTSLIGDDPIAAVKQTMGNAVPGLTVPIFAAMIRHIPYHRIVEGLLFHRFKSRAMFFMMMKFRGFNKVPALPPIKKVISISHAAMQVWMDQLESQLEGSAGPWIVGRQFTLADVGAVVIFDRLREGDWLDDFLTAERPRVSDYWQAAQDRDSYQQGCLEHAHPMVTAATEDIVAAKDADSRFLRI